MPTFRDYLATLPQEEQQSLLAEYQRRYALATRRKEVGHVQTFLEGLGVGTARGALNSAHGLAGLVANYNPITLAARAAGAYPDAAKDFFNKPLVGPGGTFANDPSRFDVGPGAALGNFAGFLASLAIPGTGVKAVRSGLGLLSKSPHLLAKAARGGAEFGLLSASRTPGDLGERFSSGAHAVPAGAIFGVAGRMKGFIPKDTGKLLVGRSAERFLEAHSLRSVKEGIERGLIAAEEAVAPYILRNSGRMGAAGLATPGFSPIEFTGQANIDSAIFNSMFSAVATVAHRNASVHPARKTAQKTETAKRDAAVAPEEWTPSPLPDPATTKKFPTDFGEGVLPGQLSLFPEGDIGFPVGPTGAQRLAGASDVLPGQLRLPFGELLQKPHASPRTHDLFTGRFIKFNPPEVEPKLPFPKEELAPTGTDQGTPNLHRADQVLINRLKRKGDLPEVEDLLREEGRQSRLAKRVEDLFDENGDLKPEAEVEPSTLLSLFGATRFLPKTNDLAADVVRTLKGQREAMLRDLHARRNPDDPKLVNRLIKRDMKLATFNRTRITQVLSRLTEKNRISLPAYDRFFSDLTRLVQDDLDGLPRPAFSKRPLSVFISDNPHLYASIWANSNTMQVGPAYFTLPRAMRRSIVAHELSGHERAMWTGFDKLDPHIVAQLFDRAGYATHIPTRARLQQIVRENNQNDIALIDALVNDVVTPQDQINLVTKAVNNHFEGLNIKAVYTRDRVKLDRSLNTPEDIADGTTTALDAEGRPVSGIIYRRVSGDPTIYPEVIPYERTPFNKNTSVATLSTTSGEVRTPEYVGGSPPGYFALTENRGTYGPNEHNRLEWGAQVPSETPFNRDLVIPIVRHTGGFLMDHSKGHESKPRDLAEPSMENIQFATVHDAVLIHSFNEPLLNRTSRKLAGRDYGHTDPLEYVAELASEVALGVDRVAMEVRHPGANQLLDGVYGSNQLAVIQGTANVKRQVLENQMGLFERNKGDLGPETLVFLPPGTKRPLAERVDFAKMNREDSKEPTTNPIFKALYGDAVARAEKKIAAGDAAVKGVATADGINNEVSRIVADGLTSKKAPTIRAILRSLMSPKILAKASDTDMGNFVEKTHERVLDRMLLFVENPTPEMQTVEGVRNVYKRMFKEEARGPEGKPEHGTADQFNLQVSRTVTDTVQTAEGTDVHRADIQAAEDAATGFAGRVPTRTNVTRTAEGSSIVEGEPTPTKTGKGRTVGNVNIFERNATLKKIIDEKLARVFATEESFERSFTDDRTRQVIRWRYGGSRGKDGYLFTREDGSPYEATNRSATWIAQRLDISTQRVNRIINNWADTAAIDIDPPEGYLFHPVTLRSTTELHPQNLVRDPVVTTRKTPGPGTSFRPRVIEGGKTIERTPNPLELVEGQQSTLARPLGRVVVEKGVQKRPELALSRDTLEGGELVKQEEFVKQGQPREAKAVFPAGVTYVDPITGATLAKQTHLFEAKDFVKRRVQAENELGVESNVNQSTDPLPSDPVEAAGLATAQAVALNLPEIHVIEPPKPAKQLAFKGKGFGAKKGVPRPGFPKLRSTSPGVAAYERYLEAKEKIGKSGMSPVEFKTLNEEQQLVHAITRLGNSSGGRRAFNARLKKYSKLLGRQYPKFKAFAKAPRARRYDTLQEMADEVQMDLEPVSGRTRGRAVYRLTERETGVVHDVTDMGTVALLLDGKARRIASAPDLEPPGYRYIKLKFEGEPAGGGKGPRPPIGEDVAADAERSGLPPKPKVTELDRHENQWVVSSIMRSLMDHAATVTKGGVDRAIYVARDLIKGAQDAQRHTDRDYQTLLNLFKKHRVNANQRRNELGAVVTRIDSRAYEIQAEAGPRAAKDWVTANRERIFEEHDLPTNERAFLRDFQDDLLPRFYTKWGLEAEYVHGFFPRSKIHKPTDAGTMVELRTPSSREFFSQFERTGELQNRNTDFLNVMHGYIKFGNKWRYLGTRAGGPLGPVDRAKEFVESYTVQRGEHRVAPTWMDPFEHAIRKSIGLPDQGIAKWQANIRGRLEKRRDRIQTTTKFIDEMNAPGKAVAVKALQQWSKHLDLRISNAQLATAADIFITLNRGRVFGMSPMRAVRHVTQSTFTVMPRVGPKIFGQAFKDLIDPVKAEQILLKARAAGAIKPAFVNDYISNRSKLLTGVEKLSFLYQKLDLWERLLSYHSGVLKSQEAMPAFKKNVSKGFDAAYERYASDSNLNMLHPAFRLLVRDQLKRGNYAGAIREHAVLLSDHAIFDYSRVNAPLWRSKVWGRVFGQYGMWPLQMLENMTSLVKWGSGAQRAKAWGLYAGAATGVYGLGQVFGVSTSDWIPFIHTLGYGGGPGLDLGADIRELVAGGDPRDSEAVMDNFQKDPAATILGTPFRLAMPMGDIFEALAAESNMTRRQRRLFGVPRGPATSRAEFMMRLTGFRPFTDEHHFKSLPKQLISPLSKPIKKTVDEAIQSVTGPE